ncbi:MAG: T9SS type A sorting domain-containing protein, partial [Flavobacteriales bacterium]
EILFQKTIGGTQTEYNATILRKGTDVRFFIETISPNGADKQVANYNTNPDIWCVTMSSTLSVKEFSTNSVKIYPNPSSGQLNIETVNASKNAQLTDATGRTFHTFDLNSGNNDMMFSNLKPGTYFIQTDTSVLKWVVE